MKKLSYILLLCFFSTSIFSKEITLNLNQAIDLAIKNNRLNKISNLNLQVANAQYQQALSANYPTLDALLYANRDKSNTIFQQRGEFNLTKDETSKLIGTLTGTTPPAAFVSALSIPADIDSVAKGRDTVRGKLELNYPIYTGGKISAIIEQARLNKNIAKQSIIRDKNSVVYDVKKYFYAYILTDELSKLAQGVYDNMKFSTDLAKDFLENGSDLKIKRTDYLNAKLTTSLIQSTLSKIQLNKKLLEGAISNLIGLKYDDELKIRYEKQEILEQNRPLQDLIKKAHILNPDVNSINIALKIKNEQIKEANSDYYPMVNLFGNVSHTYNSYEYGYLNKDNENTWSLGIAIKMSLFNGSKTKNQVLEKKLDKKIIDEQKLLLEEGLALQLKNEFIKSKIGYKQIGILKEAVATANENSKMNFKGFQYEMVDAKDLIQSQLVEVYVKADYLKHIHDYLISLATIDRLVGDKLNENY